MKYTVDNLLFVSKHHLTLILLIFRWNSSGIVNCSHFLRLIYVTIPTESLFSPELAHALKKSEL